MFFDSLEFLSWEWLVVFHFGVAGLLFLPIWLGVSGAGVAAMRAWFAKTLYRGNPPAGADKPADGL